MARSLLSFTRLDHAALTVVLVILGVLVPIVAIGAPLERWIGGAPVTVVTSGEPGPRLDLTDADTGVTARPTGDLRVTDADPGLDVRALDLGRGLLISTAVLVGLAAIRRLQSANRRGDGLGPGTVGALRALGLTLIVAPLLVHAAGAMLAGRLAVAATGEATISISPAAAGLVVMGLGAVLGLVAETFVQGQRLRHDVEGLV